MLCCVWVQFSKTIHRDTSNFFFLCLVSIFRSCLYCWKMEIANILRYFDYLCHQQLHILCVMLSMISIIGHKQKPQYVRIFKVSIISIRAIAQNDFQLYWRHCRFTSCSYSILLLLLLATDIITFGLTVDGLVCTYPQKQKKHTHTHDNRQANSSSQTAIAAV